MIEKIRDSLLSNDKPQDKNVIWIDTANPESYYYTIYFTIQIRLYHYYNT